jgi:hypothetical protein
MNLGDFDKKKPSLSDSEARLFKDIMKKDQAKKLSRESYSPYGDNASEGSEVEEYVRSTREILLQSLDFTSEEKNGLKNLLRSGKGVETKKNYFFFIYTSIDHKSFVEGKLRESAAVEGKISFLLGLTDLRQVDEDSTKTVLYKILAMLHKYAYYAYGSQSSDALSYANECLASLASVLSIGSYSGGRNRPTSTLYIDCVIDPLNPNKKFYYYVSKEDAETDEFKLIYDFYFQNEGKAAFESSLKKKAFEEKDKKIEKMQAASVKKVDVKLGAMLETYSSIIAVKLKGHKG